MIAEAQRQTYDNIIKRWFERHAREIIPLLLKEKVLAREENKNSTRQKKHMVIDEKDETEEMN